MRDNSGGRNWHAPYALGPVARHESFDPPGALESRAWIRLGRNEISFIADRCGIEFSAFRRGNFDTYSRA